MAPGSAYLQRVQILRFVAAMLVVLGHSEHEAIMRGGIDRPLGLFDWGLGVDLFFIISGFIMYHLMQDSFGRAGAPRAFLIKRLKRIVPLYWMMTLVVAAILAFGSLRASDQNMLTVTQIATSLAFIPWPQTNGEIFPVFSLGWTLNYEMMFYAVMAACLTFTRRKGLIVMGVIFAALVAARSVTPRDWWLIQFWGDPIIGEFLLGLAVAAAFKAGWRLHLPVAGIAVAFGMALAVLFYVTRTYDVVTRLVTGGIPAVLIAGAIILYGRDPAETRLTRFLALAGDASYALYLTHPFAIKGCAILFTRSGLALNWAIFIPIAALVAIGLSLAVHLAIEKPVARLLRARTKLLPTQAATS